MSIKLVQKRPTVDGHYLVKFNESGGLHLVMVQTVQDGKQVIVPDICPFRSVVTKKDLKCVCEGLTLFFHEFPSEAWWSQEPIEIELLAGA